MSLPPTPQDGPARVPSPDGHYEPEVVGAGRQTDVGYSVLAYLLAGPAGFGAIGWLAGLWLDTLFLLPVGVVLGMGLSMYVIWLRYGKT